MIPAWLANHLWQSTIFGAAAATLTVTLRKHPARLRQWLWMAASAKFLLPFALLTKIGREVGTGILPAAAAPIAPFVTSIQAFGQPFPPPQISHGAADAGGGALSAALLAVWFIGFAGLILIWCARWRAICTAVRASTPLRAGREFEALRRLERRMGMRRRIHLARLHSSTEPGIFGIVRPVLLLPAGIDARLTDEQLEAVLAHELCHARRRDNLSAAIHMLVEAVFWFHPLVWWMGARLLEERERACDEEVLELGSEPEAYAESILETCRISIASPLACVSGVTGGDLEKRIERIMANRMTRSLDLGRRLLLSAAALATVAGPIAIGLANAPRSQARQQDGAAARAAFEVASVKPTPRGTRDFGMHPTPGGGMEGHTIKLKRYVSLAFDMPDSRIFGAPDWLESEIYDIVAKAPAGTRDDGRGALRKEMLRSLLADRFQLKVHTEKKVMPLYVLTVARSGSKMAAVTGEREGDGDFAMGRGRIRGKGVIMADLAQILSGPLNTVVEDRTGLAGKYDFDLTYTPEDYRQEASINLREGGPDPDGPSLFTALQQQLGLRLESSKGPVDILVIDHVERASEN